MAMVTMFAKADSREIYIHDINMDSGAAEAAVWIWFENDVLCLHASLDRLEDLGRRLIAKVERARNGNPEAETKATETPS